MQQRISSFNQLISKTEYSDLADVLFEYDCSGIPDQHFNFLYKELKRSLETINEYLDDIKNN